MKKINRREFLKWSTAGTAALAVAGKVPGLGVREGRAAQTHIFEFTVSDAIKEMHTHVQRNTATCYFWLYRWDNTALRPNVEVPGPTIYVTAGDTVVFRVTNRLDEPHTLSIPALGFNNAANPVPVNGTREYRLTVPNLPGPYLYYDNLNVVNRVMGLHGAFVVMPAGPHPDPTNTMSWSPYPYDTGVMGPNVKGLFDILGKKGPNDPFPGLAWHQGEGADGKSAAAFPTTPFRRHIWLEHQASPTLFEAVGRNANISFTATLPNGAPQNFSGRARDPRIFVAAFTSDRFLATSNDGRANTPKLDRFNFKPQYFTINGQSGHFAHNNATIVPMHRVGEPCLVTILNAGLMTHSHHLHANHYYLLAVGSVNSPVAAADFGLPLDFDPPPVTSDNPIWIDVYQVHPMTRQDWLLPYMRCPDVPNKRALGLTTGPGDGPLLSTANPGPPGFSGSASHPVWPPQEEFTMHHPPVGTIRKNFLGTGKVDIAQRQSPLCFPAHDHSEPSQTSQGGNYNTGLIGGMYFIGDRNLNPSSVVTFPIDEDFAMMLDLGVGTIGQTAPAAGPNP